MQKVAKRKCGNLKEQIGEKNIKSIHRIHLSIERFQNQKIMKKTCALSSFA